MRPTRSLLLAVVALAAVAPVAQADEWYTDTPEVKDTLGETTETGDTVQLTGTMSWRKGPVRWGPCNTHVKAILWNEDPFFGSPVATGEVETGGMVITTPCQVYVNTGEGYVPVAGCEIFEATMDAEAPSHITTTDTAIDIDGLSFKHRFNGCGALGIPNGAEIGSAGTATGGWSNEGGCIGFSGSGDLKNPAEEAVILDGSICKEGLTLA